MVIPVTIASFLVLPIVVNFVLSLFFSFRIAVDQFFGGGSGYIGFVGMVSLALGIIGSGLIGRLMAPSKGVVTAVVVAIPIVLLSIISAIGSCNSEHLFVSIFLCVDFLVSSVIAIYVASIEDFNEL